MSTFNNLGIHLRKQREFKRLTQAQVASAVNVHCQFVSNWERGACSPPEHSFPKLVKTLKLRKKDVFEAMMKDAKVGAKMKCNARFA